MCMLYRSAVRCPVHGNLCSLVHALSFSLLSILRSLTLARALALVWVQILRLPSLPIERTLGV